MEEKIVNASGVKGVMNAYKNAQIKIGDDWYYITYDDIAEIIKKSKVKFKVEKKRTRSWVTPVFNKK